jgi:hypothetical protein
MHLETLIEHRLRRPHFWLRLPSTRYAGACGCVRGHRHGGSQARCWTSNPTETSCTLTASGECYPLP